MSCSRTPPTNISLKSAPQHHGSDPSLNTTGKKESGDFNITKRFKRKCDEISDDTRSTMVDLRNMLDDLKTQQELKYESIKTFMDNISKQNQEIKASIQLMSDKYDEVLEDVKKIQLENKQYKIRINNLEAKLEQWEINSRSSCVELKNIPVADTENKNTLIEITKKICSSVKVDVQESEIRDVFRMKLKNRPNGPIVVDFNSTLKKDGFIKSVRKYNKERDPDQRLSTATLNLKGPVKPIFVADFLTPKARKLFFLAKEFMKAENYESCWTSYGRVYLRQKASEPRIRIDNESDIDALKRRI
ncbi:unnamed protein product [Colias eurytheme]|nr:unnamed protein product [Colias eurytheme]